MKKYTIHFHGQKQRARRADSNPTFVVIDEWDKDIQSNTLPAGWQLTDFVYPRHGITANYFFHDPSHPGLFSASQTEDGKGHFNKRGTYLSQIYVEIGVTLNAPSVNVGTLGLPALPEESHA